MRPRRARAVLVGVVALQLVSETALTPYWPLLFRELFGRDEPAATGSCLTVCRSAGLLAMPLWGLIALRFPVRHLLVPAYPALVSVVEHDGRRARRSAIVLFWAVFHVPAVGSTLLGAATGVLLVALDLAVFARVGPVGPAGPAFSAVETGRSAALLAGALLGHTPPAGPVPPTPQEPIHVLDPVA